MYCAYTYVYLTWCGHYYIYIYLHVLPAKMLNVHSVGIFKGKVWGVMLQYCRWQQVFSRATLAGHVTVL